MGIIPTQTITRYHRIPYGSEESIGCLSILSLAPLQPGSRFLRHTPGIDIQAARLRDASLSQANQAFSSITSVISPTLTDPPSLFYLLRLRFLPCYAALSVKLNFTFTYLRVFDKANQSCSICGVHGRSPRSCVAYPPVLPFYACYSTPHPWPFASVSMW